MKKLILLGVAAFFLVEPALAAGAQRDHFEPESAAADAIDMRGLLELTRGNYDGAQRLFKLASFMLSDTNFTPVLYLGIAKCMDGDPKGADIQFKDYSCMARVATGQLKCPAETDPVKLASLPQAELGGLTSTCAQKMCISSLRQSYENPTAETKQTVDATMKLLDIFRTSCSK